MGRIPEDVNADDYNVLYIGHSFGRQFAESLEDYAHTAGVSNHATYIVFSGEPREHLTSFGQIPPTESRFKPSLTPAKSARSS